MSYPATFEVAAPGEMENWRPIVQAIMAIPHMIVLWVLGIVGGVVAIISWFSIVFTGKLSDGLANTQSMVLRYGMRTLTYAGFLHTEFPPFDFTASATDPGGTPVMVEFTPTLEGRDKLSSALRLIWVIPAAIFAGFIVIAAQVLWFFAFFVVLFTGAWPEAFRDFIVKALRLSVKVNAYTMLLTDEYPPFALE